jgi:ankyrin repeat protein
MLAEADPTIKDNRGNSALDYARITNNKKITELLKQ